MQISKLRISGEDRVRVLLLPLFRPPLSFSSLSLSKLSAKFSQVPSSLFSCKIFSRSKDFQLLPLSLFFFLSAAKELSYPFRSTQPLTSAATLFISDPHLASFPRNLARSYLPLVLLFQQPLSSLSAVTLGSSLFLTPPKLSSFRSSSPQFLSLAFLVFSLPSSHWPFLSPLHPSPLFLFSFAAFFKT